jgi:hypothetical protein
MSPSPNWRSQLIASSGAAALRVSNTRDLQEADLLVDLFRDERPTFEHFAQLEQLLSNHQLCRWVSTPLAITASETAGGALSTISTS